MPYWPEVPRENWERAQEMRKQPTLCERILWKAVRGNQLGSAFRRQHPIGPYIVDFVCYDAKLIVELDGDVHVDPEQIEHDKARDEYLRSRGFRVLRYANNDVLNSLEGVVEDISKAMKM
jgi:very-short-patch-repair endonuclease